MSPSIHFPSPFRDRDLPPYGAADWKLLQPVLLRRSLALSSACAMLVGLLLGLTLQHTTVAPPPPVIELLPSREPAPPPPIGPEEPPQQLPGGTPPDPNNGLPVPGDTTAVIQNPVITNQPSWPTNDTGGGEGRVPENTGGWVDTFPDRPPPDEFAALDDPPLPVYSPKPKYPDLAQQAGIEGQVVIKVLVDRQGRVTELLHVTSTPIFDDAAEKALRTWRFRPALIGHHPVPAWVVVPVRFVMQ